jgi:hypothetical protein
MKGAVLDLYWGDFSENSYLIPPPIVLYKRFEYRSDRSVIKGNIFDGLCTLVSRRLLEGF